MERLRAVSKKLNIIGLCSWSAPTLTTPLVTTANTPTIATNTVKSAPNKNFISFPNNLFPLSVYCYLTELKFLRFTVVSNTVFLVHLLHFTHVSHHRFHSRIAHVHLAMIHFLHHLHMLLHFFTVHLIFFSMHFRVMRHS